MPMFSVKNLEVSIDENPIVKGVSFDVEKGKITAMMGPNGSGKSTLAMALAGNPEYALTKGQILLDGEDITSLTPDEKARQGLFLAFQYPQEITGVTYFQFLWSAYKICVEPNISAVNFLGILKTHCKTLNMDPLFLERNVNEGFSGGEKKKAEMLQMLSLKPKYAILDETDSGLDVDALKVVAGAAESIARDENTKTGVLVITHYPKLLEYLKPDKVLVLKDGIIVATGGSELVTELEKTGFEGVENA